jgi:hypothetical protein
MTGNLTRTQDSPRPALANSGGRRQHEQSMHEPPNESADTRMTGLNGSEIKKRFDLLKGRLCEAIVEELFTALDFEVHRFGVEHASPSFAASIRMAYEARNSEWNETLNCLMRMPDLIVRRGKITRLIEVKYRHDGKLSDADEMTLRNYPYPDAFYVVIGKTENKATITCAQASAFLEAMKSGAPASNALKPLEACDHLVQNAFHHDVVSQFRRLAWEFLGKLPDVTEMTHRLQRERTHKLPNWWGIMPPKTPNG